MALKDEQSLCDLSEMLLNFDDFVNVPQYPGYRGYQLLEALDSSNMVAVLMTFYIYNTVYSCCFCAVAVAVDPSEIFESIVTPPDPESPVRTLNRAVALEIRNQMV